MNQYDFSSCKFWLKIIIKFSLIILIISSADGLELFKDGGARNQGIREYEYVGFLNYINYFFVLLVCISFFLYIKTQRSWIHLISANKILILLLLYPLILSIGLVLFDAPFSSGIFKSTCLFVSLLIYSSLLINVFPEDEILFFIQKIFFFMIVLSMLLVFFFPSFGIGVDDRVAWQGMFQHKNQLGSFCVMAAIFSLCTYTHCKVLAINNLFLAFFLIIGSASYTSILCFLIVFFFFFISQSLKKKIYRYRIFILIIFLLMSIFLVYLSCIGSVDYILGDKDFSFSGRNLIWNYGVAEISYAGFLGKGLNYLVYQNEYDASVFFAATGQALSSLHNGFITSIYDFGWFGLFIFYMICFLNKTNKIKNDYNFCFFVYSLVYVLLNTFESKGFGFNLPFFILFYFLLIVFKYKKLDSQRRIVT